MNRPTWDEYFLKLAELVATRATCARKHVGTVIVRHRRIVSTGYNGAPAGQPHCDDVGHLLKNIDGRDSCIRSLHAESNAIDQAGQRACFRATMYVTVTPCYECAKRIISSGVVRVICGGHYTSQSTELVVDFLREAGVELVLPPVSS